MHSGLKKRENSAIKSLWISGSTSVSKPKINVFSEKNTSLSDCMSSKPVNSKKCKKPPTFHTVGNSFHCVMWPEGTTSLSGRRSWNVRTVLYYVLSNVRNMYEQLRNGCSLSRKWLGHPERILMMLRGPLPVGPPDYRVGSGW